MRVVSRDVIGFSLKLRVTFHRFHRRTGWRHRLDQLQHIREAVGIARSLLQAGVLERLHEPEPDGRRYRLTVDLRPTSP